MDTKHSSPLRKKGRRLLEEKQRAASPWFQETAACCVSAPCWKGGGQGGEGAFLPCNEMRRSVVVLKASAQWPFGRPEARGTAREYIPYPKKILQEVAANMADKKQDPPILVSVLNHLPSLGVGWKVARNHWNLSGEIVTFATITEVINRRPPYELSVATGYMTVDGETTNCPMYIPQQHFSGWTALLPPDPEEIIDDFQDRTGNTVQFSNKVSVIGIDYTASLEDVMSLATECGKVRRFDWEYEGYEKSTRQAIIEYEDLDGAMRAYRDLHDRVLKGGQISVLPGVMKVFRPPSIGTDVPVTFSFGRMPATPSINW